MAKGKNEFLKTLIGVLPSSFLSAAIGIAVFLPLYHQVFHTKLIPGLIGTTVVIISYTILMRLRRKLF